MNPISSYSQMSPISLEATAFHGAYQNDAAAQTTRFSYSENQSKHITIYTDEGDRVTISTDQNRRNQYLTYEGIQRERLSAGSGNGFIKQERIFSFQHEALYVERSRNISISVDGDLNEQELEDIKKAVREIDKVMMASLYGRHMTDAAVQGKKMGKLDTIAGLEAHYACERSVMIERTTEWESKAYSGLLNTPYPNENHLIDQLSDIIKESGLNASVFKGPVKGLFSAYRNDLHHHAFGDKTHHRLAALEKQLLKIIESLSDDSYVSGDGATWALGGHV